MMVKKNVRPNPQRNIKGGIAEQESPIAISNVMVVCPSCGPSRIGHKEEQPPCADLPPVRFAAGQRLNKEKKKKKKKKLRT